MNVPEALAGTVYEQAVGRSNGHCECDLQKPGHCGLGPDKFHSTGQRCHEREAYRSPLVVAPRDPEIPEREAITLPLDQVMVLCRGCFVRRRNKTKKAREARNLTALLDEENTLFASSDLLTPTGVTIAEHAE
ncbi:hypothetical protein [Streptomyces sp. NPDC013489]|uniref:hypothetical protein n=1 Tax=Streptomyces sp. NPDC013489 TaxID=3155606 RepID=UPI0033FE8685